MYVFLTFFTFFQNLKKHDFLRFFELLHTFSPTVREAGAAVTVRTYWRGKLLLRCVCSAAREALGPTGGGDGRGHIVSYHRGISANFLILLTLHTLSETFIRSIAASDEGL